MSGRLSLLLSFVKSKVQEHLPMFAPGFNIPPSQEVPVIVQNVDLNEVEPMAVGSIDC
jgi:hypothetical protein